MASSDFFVIAKNGMARMDEGDLMSLVGAYIHGVGRMNSNLDFRVEAQSVPDMTIKVKKGVVFMKNRNYVDTENYARLYGLVSVTDKNLTIAANSSGNPRKDAIIAKIDGNVFPDEEAGQLGTVQVIQGTPAVSPVAPTDASINTAVGAGVSWIRLATVNVANGATSITQDNIESRRLFADGRSFCISRRTSTQAISSGTILNFNDDLFDPLDMHSLTTNSTRFYVPRAGYYRVQLSARLADDTGGSYRILHPRVNGTDYYDYGTTQLQFPMTKDSGGRVAHAVTWFIKANNDGDYIDFQYVHDDGGSINMTWAQVSIEHVADL